jgi:hypothetical protein
MELVGNPAVRGTAELEGKRWPFSPAPDCLVYIQMQKVAAYHHYSLFLPDLARQNLDEPHHHDSCTVVQLCAPHLSWLPQMDGYW